MTFGHISRPIVLTYCVGTLVIFSVANLLVLLSNHYYYDGGQSSYNFLSRPTTFGQSVIDNPDEPFREYDDADFNELDGCYHVYLDVGSNIGNQVGIFLIIKCQKLRRWTTKLKFISDIPLKTNSKMSSWHYSEFLKGCAC
jgi:hypothetical protein